MADAPLAIHLAIHLSVSYLDEVHSPGGLKNLGTYFQGLLRGVCCVCVCLSHSGVPVCVCARAFVSVCV